MERLSNTKTQKAAPYVLVENGRFHGRRLALNIRAPFKGWPAEAASDLGRGDVEVLILLPRERVAGLLLCERGTHYRPDGLAAIGPWVDVSLVSKGPIGVSVISQVYPRAFAKRLK